MKKISEYINNESQKITETKKKKNKKIIDLEKMLGQNLDFNSININNIILSNREMSGKNKNKRKMSFVEDIDIIVKEKKSA